MTLFDSHVHFDDYGDLSAVIARAGKAGVQKMIAIGICADSNTFAVNAARKYPEMIKASIGFDRSQASALSLPQEADRAVNSLKTMIKENASSVSAIGEIGLDFHHNYDTAVPQQKLFAIQLATARELKLPVVIHTRDAEKETLAELRKHRGEWLKTSREIGVIHCFTGSKKFACDLVELGFYISFSGIITFDNVPELHDVVRIVPDNRLLIETDSPYLAPVPHRGKQNEPAYLRHVAERIAVIKGITPEEAAALTSANACELFGR